MNSYFIVLLQWTTGLTSRQTMAIVGIVWWRYGKSQRRLENGRVTCQFLWTSCIHLTTATSSGCSQLIEYTKSPFRWISQVQYWRKGSNAPSPSRVQWRSKKAQDQATGQCFEFPSVFWHHQLGGRKKNILPIKPHSTKHKRFPSRTDGQEEHGKNWTTLDDLENSH